jgi:hypothetical protein
MMHLRSRPGYIFLVTVLMIGAIASTTLLSLLLLGWAAEQNGYLQVQSQQAFEYAETCAERAIRSVRLDPTYVGDETFTFGASNCTIHLIGGTGNIDRSICVESLSGRVVRRMEIDIARLFPSVVVRSWQEVTAFSLCP